MDRSDHVSCIREKERRKKQNFSLFGFISRRLRQNNLSYCAERNLGSSSCLITIINTIVIITDHCGVAWEFLEERTLAFASFLSSAVSWSLTFPLFPFDVFPRVYTHLHDLVCTLFLSLWGYFKLEVYNVFNGIMGLIYLSSLFLLLGGNFPIGVRRVGYSSIEKREIVSYLQCELFPLCDLYSFLPHNVLIYVCLFSVGF